MWVICAQISLRAMDDAGQPDVSSAAQSVWLFLYLKPDTREKWREVQFSVFFYNYTHSLLVIHAALTSPLADNCIRKVEGFGPFQE